MCVRVRSCVRACVCVCVCVCVCACVCVVALFADFIYFFLKISHENEIIFHFLWIFKNGWGRGGGGGAGRELDRVGLSKFPEPHLDPPLDRSRFNRTKVTQLL